VSVYDTVTLSPGAYAHQLMLCFFSNVGPMSGKNLRLTNMTLPCRVPFRFKSDRIRLTLYPVIHPDDYDLLVNLQFQLSMNGRTIFSSIVERFDLVNGKFIREFSIPVFSVDGEMDNFVLYFSGNTSCLTMRTAGGEGLMLQAALMFV
jgi:hypothetical protein